MEPKKIVTIIIQSEEGTPIKQDLNIRYMLADTIKARGIGEIINEGCGEGFVEVSFISHFSEKDKKGIDSIVEALGLSDCTLIDVEDMDEE